MVAHLDGEFVWVRRRHQPLRGFWAPPTGYVEWDESTEEAAVGGEARASDDAEAVAFFAPTHLPPQPATHRGTLLDKWFLQVVGINGPSGAIYGIRLLKVLREVANIETHLVISNSAKQNIALETDHTVEYICGLAGSCQVE